MIKVTIRPHWEISVDAGAPLDTAALLGMLLAIQTTGSIAQAAKAVHLSYRYAWGLLRDAEQLFGAPLLSTGRGRGTQLTVLAQKLVWADRRVAARLSPTLESLASELEGELSRITTKALHTLRMDASHGFAVAALLEHLNVNQLTLALPIELRYRNSTDAVAALARKECDLAGFHVPTGEFEATAMQWYARWLDPAHHCLIHLAVRDQGLFVAPGNPRQITGLRDLARKGIRFVNRQTGSGTRMLLELMLAQAGLSTHDIEGYNSSEFTHSAVAAYIASGMADVGIGVKTAAQRFGLGFIPLLRERYFFAIPLKALEEPLMQQFIGILQSPAYHRLVNQLSGYDATDTGKILLLEEAFGKR
ncbi:substrate-binding domain-containing protein [soil metagenome]